MNETTSTRQNYFDPLLLVVLGVATVVSLREFFDSSLGYPDADRILMDGVFILDFLSDLTLDTLLHPREIYDFTTNYFAQYPALSIGYRPPFFPLIEALFNGLFGVNTWSSRLAILPFWFAGLAAWFYLVNSVTDRMTAFWTCLLLATTPFVAKFAWYTMAEIPVLSMSMVTVYLFHRYVETDRKRFLYAAAAAFSIAAWTKQTAVLLGLWFVLYALFARKLGSYLLRRETWIAAILLILSLAPLAAITLWLGDQNIAQSLGSGEKSSALSRLSLHNLTIQLDHLRRFHLEGPILLLALLGIAWAGLKRDRRALLFATLFVSVYLFVTYIVGKNERYPIFWIPPLVFFAVLPFFYLRDKDPRGLARGVVLIALVGFNLLQLYGRDVNRATGYDEAARYVLEHSVSPTVFFDGYNNGYFTYFMRALDPERSMYVLRGDKLLSSSSIFAMNVEVHARTANEIQAMIERYGVEFVVIEKNNYIDLEIHQILRDLLASGPYDRVMEIPMTVTNREPLFGQSLLIYQAQKPTDFSANFIELRLPVVGKTLRVPVRGWVKSD